MKTCFFSFLTTVLAVSALLWAYPEPAIVPDVNQWTLDVSYDQPRQITLEVADDQGNVSKQRFWYIILTLTNHATAERPFYPSCDLMTDTFQVVQAGRGVTMQVFDRIKVIHQGSFPFLEPLDLAGNKILQGEDNTKDIAIIWPDFDSQAKNITLFIAGLSNETAVIDHPLETDENGDPSKVFLRKTLALEYSIGGDAKLRATAGLKFKKEHWVMR